MLKIDHFVFGTRDLAEGTDWMRDALGVPPVGSGQHVQMGTYNSLWRLGTAYVEVIAINPDAPTPETPRWYGMDDPGVQARIAGAPHLINWVVATDDLEAALAASPLDPGPARQFARDDLHWFLTVPEDGMPHFGGAYPAIITWPEGVAPPSATLPDQGLVLKEFVIAGPTALQTALSDLGALPLLTGFEEADETDFRLIIDSPATGSVMLG